MTVLLLLLLGSRSSISIPWRSLHPSHGRSSVAGTKCSAGILQRGIQVHRLQLDWLQGDDGIQVSSEHTRSLSPSPLPLLSLFHLCWLYYSISIHVDMCFLCMRFQRFEEAGWTILEVWSWWNVPKIHSQSHTQETPVLCPRINTGRYQSVNTVLLLKTIYSTKSL